MKDKDEAELHRVRPQYVRLLNQVAHLLASELEAFSPPLWVGALRKLPRGLNEAIYRSFARDEIRCGGLSIARRLKEVHRALVALLSLHDRLDDKGRPESSDAEYDALKELALLVERRADVESKIDIKIGRRQQAGFQPVKHLVPMRSLENAFSEQKLEGFVGRILQILES